MKKHFSWVLIIVICLIGCAGDDPVEMTASPSITATNTFEAVVTHTPVPATVEPAAETLLSSPTPQPTATITPSPTPYVCSFLLGRTESGTFYSDLMREQVAYLVHLPPCYDQYPDRAFPTLYLFHGWPLNEYHWLNLGVHLWADDYIDRSITGPFVIVMPGVGSEGLYVNSSGGSNSFEGMVVDELLPHIDSSYRTWRSPEARAVGGISRGGVWALEIALRHQDLFSIAGGHSPALALNRPLPQYDPYRLVTQDKVALRFYLDAGDRDWARAGAISFRNLLTELNIPVTYDLHEGGHVDALWSSGLSDYLLFYAQTWPSSYDLLPQWSIDPGN